MILSDLSQRTRDTLLAIQQLPISIGFYTDISVPYVIERKAIKTEAQLKDFTKRWASVWNIPWIKNWKQEDSDRQIISGLYDAKDILKCIIDNSADGLGCSHINEDKHCISADIIIPPFLMKILEIRIKFEVPDGTVLIQLIRVINEDLRDVDPDDFYGYINSGKPPVGDEM